MRVTADGQGSMALPPAIVLGAFPVLSETFILRELDAMDDAGFNPRVYALDRSRAPVIHAAAIPWMSRVRFVPRSASPVRDIAAWHALCRGDRPRALQWLRRLLVTGCRFPRMTVRCLRRLPAIADLGVEAREGRIGCLHAHFATLPAEIAWAAALYAGCPFGISTHAHDIFTQSPAMLRFKLNAAAWITGCTAAHVDYLRELAPPDARSRVTLVYHGVDVPHEAAPAPPAGQRILAIGRLAPKKAFDVLIDACALLAAQGESVDCEVIGEGPERSRLERRIRRHGLVGQVRLPGARSMEALTPVWRSAAIVAVPGRVLRNGDRDGIPNVLLEAMVRGLPVIAAESPPVREVIRHDVNGWRVDREDAPALAAALRRLLQDAALRERLGRQAALSVRRDFDAADHTHRWMQRLATLSAARGLRDT